MRVVVQLEVGAAQRAVAVAPAASAQRQAHAGHQFRHRERLHHVVVAADREPVHAVVGGVAGGEEDHRHLRAVVAHAAQHGEPVDIGQHHVEHHQIGTELVDRRERGLCRRAQHAVV